MTLMKDMRSCASAGVTLLERKSADALSSAVLKLRHANGGFCGLDGQPDLYYSLFAVLILEALKSRFDESDLLRWVKRVCAEAKGVDRHCAEILLLRSGLISRGASRLRLLRSLAGAAHSDSYKLFLVQLLMEELLPEGLNRFLLRQGARSLLKERVRQDFSALGTPGSAVCLMLASEMGDGEAVERMLALLKQRHRASGGFSSAPGVHADLLSTAVVLFAARQSGNKLDVVHNDRAFVEMCWQEDGLFSASPDQEQGDLEHTFYGLLALGCM